jgi:hypothetical protein
MMVLDSSPPLPQIHLKRTQSRLRRYNTERKAERTASMQAGGLDPTGSSYLSTLELPTMEELVGNSFTPVRK